MTTYYKLTGPAPDYRSKHGNMSWGEGVEHTETGGRLCDAGVIHAYESPEMAAFYNPLHAGYGADAVLWRCAGDEHVRDHTKVGLTRCRTVEIVPLPVLSTEQCVEVAIRAVILLPHLPDAWVTWAQGWIDGTDRSAAAAAEAWAAAAEAWAAEAAAAAEAWAAAAAAWAAEAWAAEAAAAAEARAATVAAAEKAGDYIDLTAIIRGVLANEWRHRCGRREPDVVRVRRRRR